MATNLQKAFLSLVRLGIGAETVSSFKFQGSSSIDWEALQALANEQGLSAVLIDGIEKLPEAAKPPKLVLLQWIGEVLQSESVNYAQQKAAAEMALLFHNNGIRTYVLKGAVVAECYPKPEHRFSADVDCFLLPEKGDFDAWELGNSIIRSKGFDVDTGFYKNSTFSLPDLTVENHQFLTPFRGNKTLKALERVLQALLTQDEGSDRFEGTWLYRPPVMVSALFLIEHAYSHFLHEGLTWRHVLDWMMFLDKHKNDINMEELSVFVDEFKFRDFYDSYLRIGKYLMGDLTEDELSEKDQMMLADVWQPLDLHETVHGLKGKLSIAGNAWKARWKYRHFSEISMLKALWILLKGYLFLKHPKLD